MKRFEEEGIQGLKTRPGRGGKPILKAETDLEKVREAVSRNRQRLSLVRAELETVLGKTFSDKTLNRFVKKNDCRYKRIRRLGKREPLTEVYRLKVECLKVLETLIGSGRN